MGSAECLRPLCYENPYRAKTEHNHIVTEAYPGIRYHMQCHADRFQKCRCFRFHMLGNDDQIFLWHPDIFRKASITSGTEKIIVLTLCKIPNLTGFTASAWNQRNDGNLLMQIGRLHLASDFNNLSAKFMSRNGWKMIGPLCQDTRYIRPADTTRSNLDKHIVISDFRYQYIFHAKIIYTVKNCRFHISFHNCPFLFEICMLFP